MTIKAIILIETKVEVSLSSISEALKAIEGVESVDAVTGPYNLIVRLTAADLNAVGDMVTLEIHLINGLIRTVTCLVVER